MPTSSSLRALAIGAALALAPNALADSLRCDGRIVSVGDSQVDLLGRCGQPAFVEARVEQRGALAIATDAGPAAGERVTRSVETWTYDFGPNRFVQVVRLEDGKIVAVNSGGRGFAVQKEPVRLRRARCAPAVIDEGDLMFEVLAACGEPAVRTRRLEERLIVSGSGPEGGVAELFTREVEVWTYDFGPNTLVRFVEIVDGKVSRVETGSRGYAADR